MAETFEIDDASKETVYTFRFGTSNKIIHLTERQLNLIPYLSILLIHKNDFQCVQNENGEYILSSRIRYSWFNAILKAIINERPSALFTELPQEANALGMLQLYDYLCINPIPVPLLRDEYLARLKTDDIVNNKRHIKYHRANLSEARDTAVQFIIALSKNQYNLDDFETLQSVFSLFMVILSNSSVFGLRLCHHTLTVLKKYCFSYFSQKQQCQLYKVEQIIQSNKTDALMYLCNDDQPLPENFQNTFAWKGVYVSIEENDSINCRSSYNKRFTHYDSVSELIIWLDRNLWTEYNDMNWLDTYIQRTLITPFSIRSLGNCIPSDVRLYLQREQFKYREEHHPWLSLRSSIHMANLYNLPPIYIYQIKQELKKIEAQSARSGRFNTLPKRPKIDKFKHRCRPKAQKYR